MNRATAPFAAGSAALALSLVAFAVQAATPLQSVQASPDVTVVLSGTVVDDEGIAADNLAGTVTPVGLGALPPDADVDAYHVLPDGRKLLSFDATVLLPGGVTARPADVVAYDGAGYTILFEAAPIGVPIGVDVDAVTTVGNALLLSFDVGVEIGGTAFDDEDLVRFEGGAFAMFFDGSAHGIAPELDLDAADVLPCNGHVVLSFDGSGTVGGIDFDDEDLLEHDLVATWELAYDGSASHVAWETADLDAVFVAVDPGPGPPVVFGQTLVAAANKSNFGWAAAVSYRAVRGSFTSSSSIGAYTVTANWSGSGTFISDPSTPPVGSGTWYLVKPGGCAAASWQSMLGAEPGRDAALP